MVQHLKNVLASLAKSVLIPLELTATDAVIGKKIYGSGVTTLIISIRELGDIVKIVQSLV